MRPSAPAAWFALILTLTCWTPGRAQSAEDPAHAELRTMRAALLDAILNREKQGSTGLGNGIAIPHARTDGVRDVAVALGVSASGMDFDSADGKPCHLIFLIAAPLHESTRYLEALAAVASLGERASLVAQLKSVRSVDDALAFFKSYRKQSE